MEKHLFYIHRDGQVIATGYYEDGQFVVVKGSFHNYTRVLSPLMKEQQVLEEDMSFPSPSAAGVYCLNKRTCNGWTEWKDENGNTLDDVYRKGEQNNLKD